MKPFKLFLFFALIFVALSLFSWLTPQEGWHLFGIDIHFLKYNLAPQPTAEQAHHNPDKGAYALQLPKDSIQTETSQPLASKDSDTETNHPGNRYIEGTKGKTAVENTPLDFWASINQLTSNLDSTTNQQIRILYYGDSQIENDRITSSLRKTLQDKFGGSGRGLVPITDIYNTANNFIMSVSGNWRKTSVVGNKKKNLDAALLCESYTLSKKKSLKESTASSIIKIKTIDTSKKGGYSLVGIYYQTPGASTLEVFKDGKPVHKQELKANAIINELKLNFGETPSVLELMFTTSSELSLYGLSMESPTGIQVDNIALRGKSTPEFTRLDQDKFRQMARFMKPSMVILHFGVNVIPNVANNYGFYKNLLATDIHFLKENLDGIPVLLVSASDMAHKENTLMVSYANIPNVVQAQKEAATENGCAFWDLYTTMGGAGSMVEWVEKTPPWGNTDYIHFTSLGAHEVGKLLSNIFIENIKTTKTQELAADGQPF